MLNIISKSVNSDLVSGPQKVVKNLIKGLDILAYPYVVNHALDSCHLLWIHDDLEALKKVDKLNNNIKVVAGPNIFILARHISSKIDLSKIIYIHPSPWAMNFWADFGFNKCKLDFWPTGIDTEIFLPSTDKKENVLIYFKQRFRSELEFVKKILEDKNITFNVIEYGNYRESEYINYLKNTRYIIWLGRQESQGIALEEAMSMNIPILVWDVSFLGHWTASKKEMAIFNDQENKYREATSAFYFDNNCGVKVKEEKDIPQAIDLMEKKWSEFSPRQYVLDNLNLVKQAKDLIYLYEKHYQVSYEDGLKEKLMNNKKWKNSKKYFIILTKLKSLAKKILNLFKRCFLKTFLKYEKTN